MPSTPPLLALRHVTVLRQPFSVDTQGDAQGNAQGNAPAPTAQADLTSHSVPTPHVASTSHADQSSRPALDDLTLQIEAGEHVCILGPNGSGKSTLIKTITRECYPLAREDSSMSILGRERWNIFELRSLLGVVSPDLLASCTSDATGRDVVLSGFFSSTRIFPHHHPDPQHLARATDTLARLGIAHLANRSVAQMSSGEAKRMLIARALVHEPRALLFDEPSNALDIAAQFQLRDTLRRLAQSGIAILLVTHHVSEIIPEIDRVILLREGHIVADGPNSAVLTASQLSHSFGVPVRLAEHEGFFQLS